MCRNFFFLSQNLYVFNPYVQIAKKSIFKVKIYQKFGYEVKFSIFTSKLQKSQFFFKMSLISRTKFVKNLVFKSKFKKKVDISQKVVYFKINFFLVRNLLVLRLKKLL